MRFNVPLSSVVWLCASAVYIRALILHKGFLRQQVLLADEKLKADQKNILIDGFLLVSIANTPYSNPIV